MQLNRARFISHATVLITSLSAKHREKPSNAVNLPLPACSDLIVFLFINYSRSYLKYLLKMAKTQCRCSVDVGLFEKFVASFSGVALLCTGNGSLPRGVSSVVFVDSNARIS